MRRAKLLAMAIGIAAALSVPAIALGAHDSQAMAQHMRLMAEENPGMLRMMQTPMGHMDDSPAFQMPPVHP